MSLTISESRIKSTCMPTPGIGLRCTVRPSPGPRSTIGTSSSPRAGPLSSPTSPINNSSSINTHYCTFLGAEETAYSTVLRHAGMDTLKWLANGVLLEPGSSLSDLVQFVNDRWNPRGAVISPEITREIKSTIKSQSWPEVKILSLNPVNSSAVLLHWQILAFLFDNMMAYDQKRFMAMEQKIPPPPEEDTVPEEPEEPQEPPPPPPPPPSFCCRNSQRPQKYRVRLWSLW